MYLYKSNLINNKKLFFNTLINLPSKNLFTMANKCKHYPFDELWKLALRINKGKYNDKNCKVIFDKITKERTGVKITNLSAMMFLCKPNRFYVLDKKGAIKQLELISIDEETHNILENIIGNIKGSYGLDIFFKLQNLCIKNKNIIGTPYEFYLESRKTKGK